MGSFANAQDDKGEVRIDEGEVMVTMEGFRSTLEMGGIVSKKKVARSAAFAL